MLILSVRDGKVHLNEGDHGPACGMMNGGSSYDRDLYEIELQELMTALKVQDLNDFFREMKRRFGYYDGFTLFYDFLKANKIEFSVYAG